MLGHLEVVVKFNLVYILQLAEQVFYLLLKVNTQNIQVVIMEATYLFILEMMMG
jgi:hypothetical protein